MNKSNGGAAFPVAAGPGQQFTQGMSLRDWFAANALHGVLSCRKYEVSAAETAAYAYSFADAMLAEREKQEVGK